MTSSHFAHLHPRELRPIVRRAGKAAKGAGSATPGALPKSITRVFTSLSQAVQEAQSARVYAGLHFSEGCVVGARQGTQIRRFVTRHELGPLLRK